MDAFANSCLGDTHEHLLYYRRSGRGDFSCGFFRGASGAHLRFSRPYRRVRITVFLGCGQMVPSLSMWPLSTPGWFMVDPLNRIKG